MDPSIQLLEIAPGLKDSLESAGYTLESILSSEPNELASRLGIEPYVARIVFEEAKKIGNGKASLLEDASATTGTI
jgi:hypothetical protein